MNQKLAGSGHRGSPLVSIYIPTHNRPELLARAIASCQVQDYKNLEILVSDDGSGPETEELVRALMERDPRIRFFRSPSAKGACHARNIAISHANGEFITGLDDDDEFLPNRVSTLLRDFRAGDFSFVCANMYVRDEGSSDIGSPYYFSKKDLEFDYQDLLFKNCASNQVLTRTGWLRDIGGFNERIRKFQDWDTWLRLAHRYGKFLRLAQPLYVLYNDPSIHRVSKSITHEQALEALFLENVTLYSPMQAEIMRFLVSNRTAPRKIKSICASALSMTGANLLRHYTRVAYRNYLRNFL